MALTGVRPVRGSYSFSGRMFDEVSGDSQWRAALRAFEIRSVLEEFPPDAFENALELGCGDGTGSAFLEPWCRRLTATDYDAAKFRAASTEQTTFAPLDAQELSAFREGSLDLVFSSNLLEHLPDVEKCLREIARVLKPGGYAVHLLPNRTWKLFNMLLFYPLLAQSIFRKLLSRNERAGDSPGNSEALDDNLRAVSDRRRLCSSLFPRIHGYASSHLDEWQRWGEGRWLALFSRSGMRVERVVRLPFYFGHGYSFRPILRLGNRFHWSSSTGYIMRKR